MMNKNNEEAKKVADGIIMRMIVDMLMGVLMVMPPAIIVGRLIATWNPLWILAFIAEYTLIAYQIYDCYFVRTEFCKRYDKYYGLLVKGIESLE